MRKNRTKHEAKKPRLAKRALALCFALIFVCSCLLPAFANSGENQLTDLAQETVVEPQQDEQKPTEPVLLTEGGTDSTEGDKEQDEQKQEEANASKETSKEPSSSSSGEASGESQSTAPSESASSEGSASTAPGESASSSASSEEPAASSSASSEEPAASSSASSEESAASSSSSSEAASSSASASSTVTSGDVINQGEAVYTYRFWTKEIDAFDLERVDLAVKNGDSLTDAAKSVTGIAPCEVLKVADNAHLADYTVTEPTKDGYEFAGWYTLDNGTPYEFSFDQNVSFEKSKTIDVFAKWNELKAVKSDALSNDGMTVEAKVGPMDNVESVTLAVPSQDDAETLRNSIDEKLYDQSYMAAILDITPKDKDGMAVEPQNGESVNVEISGLGFSAGDNVWVYHLTNSGRVETLSATVTSDGGVEFTTKSFSPFAVVKLTEDVSSFGTEDDRLATADLQLNYEMKVGDTNTLYGGSRYYYYHKWSSSNPDVVAVTGSDYSARVEAKSVGTAEITHYHGYSSSYYWTESTNVTVVSPTGSWVYLYAAFEDNKIQGYTPSGSHWANKYWVTIGKLWVDNIADISGNRGFDGTHVTDGTNYSNVIKALNDYKDGSDSTKFERFEANKGINIDNIVWNWTETYDGKNVFGLSQGGGASPYVTNANTPTWHLDGYAQRVGAYKINYLEKDTNRVLKPSVESVGTAGTIIRADDFKVDPISFGGKTYNCVGRDKDFVTIIDGDTVQINLYYEHEVDLGSLPESDKPFIMVEKRFSGLTEKSQIPSGFAITVGGKSYGVDADNVTHSQLDTDSNAYVVRWKVKVDDAGSYTVSESGYQKGGFTVTTKINGETVDNPTNGTSVTVTVPELENWKPHVISEKRQRNFKVNMAGDTNNIFVARLKHAVIVFTQKPLSNPQRDAVTQKLTEPMDKAGAWYDSSKKIYFYSVEEQLAHGTFEIDGTTVRYDASKSEIVFSEQSFWTHVATVSYSTTNAENPEVSITNTYKPNTLDIQITKQVTSGDNTKDFKFKVTGDKLGNQDKRTLTDENGTKLDRIEGFTMKNGKTVTLHNVEAGMKVNVAEFDTYRYDVTATNYSTPAVANSKGEKTFNYEVVLDEASGQLVLKTEGGVTVENNHIYVYNTPATTSLTVTKTATKDNVEDTTTEFNFTLTLGSKSENVTWSKNGNTDTVAGPSYEFKLKGGESITFSGISVYDTDVKVEEASYSAQHYTTTIKVNGEAVNNAKISAETLKQHQEAGTKVEFTNAYTTPKLPSMTIQKVVTGAFGERTKEFTFNVKLTDKEGHTVDVTHPDVANLNSFTLKHGKQVTLKEIPIGTTITVTETDANEYKTKATNYDTYVSNRTFVYKVVEQGGVATLVTENGLFGAYKKVDGTAITVENNFDGTPDTGVLLDTLPYLILLAVAVAGGVLVVVRKRKHRDE